MGAQVGSGDPRRSRRARGAGTTRRRSAPGREAGEGLARWSTAPAASHPRRGRCRAGSCAPPRGAGHRPRQQGSRRPADRRAELEPRDRNPCPFPTNADGFGVYAKIWGPHPRPRLKFPCRRHPASTAARSGQRRHLVAGHGGARFMTSGAHVSAPEVDSARWRSCPASRARPTCAASTTRSSSSSRTRSARRSSRPWPRPGATWARRSAWSRSRSPSTGCSSRRATGSSGTPATRPIRTSS